jgi:hypothetical protein
LRPFCHGKLVTTPKVDEALFAFDRGILRCYYMPGGISFDCSRELYRRIPLSLIVSENIVKDDIVAISGRASGFGAVEICA